MWSFARATQEECLRGKEKPSTLLFVGNKKSVSDDRQSVSQSAESACPPLVSRRASPPYPSLFPSGPSFRPHLLPLLSLLPHLTPSSDSQGKSLLIHKLTKKASGGDGAVALEYTFARAPDSQAVRATRSVKGSKGCIVLSVFTDEGGLRRLGTWWWDSLLQSAGLRHHS